MNDRQQKILMVCGAVIGITLLYPPFQLMGRGMGYGWIFSPPHDMSIINTGQLIVQWVAIALIGGIAFVLSKQHDSSGTVHSPLQSSVLAQKKAQSESTVVRTNVACITCGNRETIVQKRTFLGFAKHLCTVCNSEFNDQLTPLSTGYRVGYWIGGFIFASYALPKLPRMFGEVIGTASYYPSELVEVLPPFVFLLVLVVGPIWALLKDWSIRRRVKATT
jgi:hypothetical protein